MKFFVWHHMRIKYKFLSIVFALTVAVMRMRVTKTLHARGNLIFPAAVTVKMSNIQ